MIHPPNFGRKQAQKNLWLGWKEFPFILIKGSSELAFFQNSEDESFVQAYKIATENKFIQPHSENIQKDMHSGKVAVFEGNLN